MPDTIAWAPATPIAISFMALTESEELYKVLSGRTVTPQAVDQSTAGTSGAWLHSSKPTQQCMVLLDSWRFPVTISWE